MIQTATIVGFARGTPQAATKDVSIGRISMWGTRAWLAYRRDEPEWQRRSRVGLGAVVRLDVLDVLMDLPARMAIPLRALQPAERRLLDRTPSGVVSHGRDTVTRQIVPAVMPLLAIVPSRDWRAGTEAASRFASYCPRMISLPRHPADIEQVLAQASLYGIGVACKGADSSEIVLEPEPLADWQPTPAWWAFCEELYAQVRQHDS